jgi:putative IMPACT (imprinted ancient) family translation regulator
VLQGSDLGDAAAVITRYFGGSKLGTGGLVRAYSEAIRSVLEVLPRAEKIATCTCQITMPYALFERVRLLSEAHHGIIRNEIFAAEVTVTAEFATAKFADFQQALKELSHGSLTSKIIATNEAAIMPVGSFPDH